MITVSSPSILYIGPYYMMIQLMNYAFVVQEEQLVKFYNNADVI